MAAETNTPEHLVRLIDPADAEALTDYLVRNREPHREWSPIPPPGFFTVEFQRARLQRVAELQREEREFRFGIFTGEDRSHLAGTISLTAVERGVFQNGRLGYSTDAAHQRRGLMTAGVRHVVGYAFGSLGLHRLEANVIPRNTPSHRVMQKCGFTRIGFSPRMVMINGVWEDHDMYMILAGDHKAGGSS
jgi:ribosomal-protein-alanine N-acetyltransferase